MASAVALPLLLQDSPHSFLQPSLPLYTDTLAYLKHALDPLAADISVLQQQRRQDARKKRKRGERVDESEVLRLKEIHVEGFGLEQVWEQARRVIDAAREEAERGFAEALVRQEENGGGSDDESVAGGVEVGSQAQESDLGEEGVDYEIEGVDDGEEEYEGDSEDLDVALDQAEDGADDYEEDEDVDMDAEIDIEDGDMVGKDPPAEELIVDKFGLNEGSFSIDEFNKQSEFLEQRDVPGENDGAASDEEEIDWDADIFAQTGAGAADGAESVDGEDDDEDGPTFGDPDAPSEDEDDGELDAGEMDAMGGMGNTNQITYAEFFAPPAQKKRKNKKGRPNPHNFPAAPTANGAPADEAEDDGDMERTMAAVHRDLFDDAESAGEEEEEQPAKALDPSDPRSRRSAHERRKAALAEEIRKLEAANVAKREWTLSGEARAADRPLNSLLEEDLEFERAGKPIPVITAEVSESIEALIKRRILAYDFQDLVRRRPDDLATGGKDSKRGILAYEVDDNKSKKGLAEEYEEEHLRRTDPNFTDAKDEKAQKEEKEIEALWNKIRSDLDSLSSWHFRPKAPAPALEIRVDAPAIRMEDARPSGGGEVAGASQLAPQEIYRGGEAASGREEVVGKSGLPAAREEMTGEERKRRRRRAKERIRKAGGGSGEGGVAKVEGKDGKGEGGKGKGRSEVLGDLKKGGVKIIGKKGVVTDVEGKEAKGEEAGGQKGAGRYKL
ncbi:U3 snoRNP protein [Friedmanniomyces endolithicus]|nr:U3 snoRNP protein [Friedmanniomyces endolithicus]